MVAQFQDLINLADEMIFILNADGILESSNSRFHSLIKIQLKDNLFDLLHPEDFARYFPLSSQAEAHELTLRVKNHRLKYQEFNFKVKVSPQENVFFFVGREKKLSREELYKRALESLPLGITIKDALDQFKIIFANQRALDLMDRDLSEVIGKVSSELYPDDVAQRVVELETRCMRELGFVESVEMPMYSQKTGLIYVNAQKTPILNASNEKPQFLLGTFEEVTEKKYFRDNLIERENMFRELFEGAPMPMLISDECMGIISANKAFLDLFEYSAEELSDMRASVLKHSADWTKEQQRFFQMKKSEKELIHFQKTMSTKNKKTIYVKVNISPLNQFLNKSNCLLIFEDITESVIQSRELDEQNQFFAGVTASIPGMIHVLEKNQDGKLRTIFASSGSHTLYGVSPEEIVNGDLLFVEMIHPEDRPGWFAKVQEASLKLGTDKYEFRFTNREGQERWALAHFTVTKTLDSTVRFNTIHIDITDAKENEKRLKMFEEILANTPDIVACRTLDGVQPYRNKAFINAFMKNSDSPISLEKIYPPAAYKRILGSAFPHALEHGFWSGENEIITKDGKLIPISQMVICHKDKNLKPIFFSTIMRDISDIKTAHLELRHVMDAVSKSAIVMTLDKEGELLEVNDNFCSATGFDRQEIIGKSYRILSSGVQSDEFVESIWDHINLGRVWQGETQLRCKNGSSILVQSVISPIFDANNNIKKFIAIRFDITEMREMHRKLILSSKMSSLGEMAGGIAHEINNPLAIISGKATQMKRILSGEDIDHGVLEKHAETIDKTAHRIADIVKGLRSFSRDAERDPFDKVKVISIIQETLSFCQARFANHNTFLTVNDFDHSLLLECRPAQISHVILNLLSNGFDAVQVLKDKWVKIEVKDLGEQIEISVVDSGAGIPKNIREKMMMPFFTTKDVGKGTGLGLSIVSGLVKAHGGTIEIDEKSKSTKFVLSFPKNQNKEKATA